MNLTRFAVQRPVATLMAFLTVSLFGFISWFKLPQDLFPPVTFPQVTIVTGYPNAAPEELENLITRPIEESISTVGNLKKIKSISREGISMITAEFGWNTRIDFAALGIRQKIDLVKESLPRECREPIVKKINPFDLPVLILSLRGSMPGDKLQQYAKKILKETLSKTEGVASVAVQGGKEYEIHVDVDAGLLKARNLDLTRIGKTLRDSNLNYPAGTTKETYYEYLLRTQGEFESMDEIGDTILETEVLKNKDPALEESPSRMGIIRLGDIAEIKKEFAETKSISRFNGTENIMLSVYKQSDANVLNTVRKLKDTLENLKKTETQPVQIDIIYDKSVFIRDAIENVKSNGMQGGILAFIVLLFFLQSISASLIVALSIPVSVLITLILMYSQGVSINLMSLGGLALGVGMVVDCSTCVVENYMRKREENVPAEKAAMEGTDQVWTSIFASTLTSIAVFFPMVFLSGVEGQLFKELAFTVTFSLIASLGVSMTLIPRFACLHIRTASGNVFFKTCEGLVRKAENTYRLWLKKLIPHTSRVLSGVFLLFLASLYLFLLLPREMLPKVDEGQFVIKAEMPPGTRLDITDHEVSKLEKLLLQKENVKNVSVSIGSSPQEAQEGSQFLGSHQALITVVLQKDRKQRTETFIEDFYKTTKPLLSPKMNLEFKISASGIASAVSSDQPVVVRIQCDDTALLNQAGKTVREYLSDVPGLLNIKTTRADPSPETKIIINKEKASLLGLSAQDISLAAQTAIKGTGATELKDDKGREIPVIVRLAEKDRSEPASIENITLWAGEDTLVKLGDVVTFKSGMGPSEILRIDQRKVIMITADLSGNASRKKVFLQIRELLETLSPRFKGAELECVEATAEEKNAFFELIMTLVLSILLVYMIMASQFESLVQPFLIMITVPLGIIGVSLSLWLTNTSLSIVSSLGMILLGGIVVNNGIILVEYFNQSCRDHSDIVESVIEACVVRFRPIMITTSTNLLGLLPMAIASGEGSELMSPMSISVLGGLFVSTALTLLAFPLLYIAVSRFQNNPLKPSAL